MPLAAHLSFAARSGVAWSNAALTGPCRSQTHSLRASRESLRFSDDQLQVGQLSAGQQRTERVLERLKTREPISFLFSLIDTTTGRELQDQPVHNLAALGSAEGARPFRLLARPITFSASASSRSHPVLRSAAPRPSCVAASSSSGSSAATSTPTPAAVTGPPRR